MPMFLKPTFFRLADELVAEGKLDSAIAAMDKCYEWFLPNIIPYSWIDHYLARTYLTTRTQSGVEKGVELYNKIIDQILLENDYYRKFTGKKASFVDRDLKYNMDMLREIGRTCNYLKSSVDENLAGLLDSVIERLELYVQ